MGAILTSTYFNSKGYLVGRVQKTLPESLDWKCIDEKEIFIRYLGGMPPETTHALLESQGETKLIGDLEDDSKIPLDHHSYRKKIDGAEAHLDERCKAIGIDRSRKPRNQ